MLKSIFCLIAAMVISSMKCLPSTVDGGDYINLSPSVLLVIAEISVILEIIDSL